MSKIGQHGSGGSRVVTGIQRCFGSDLAENIAQKVQTNDIGAVLELLSNCYNADACRVDIIMDPEGKHLIIRDDGAGMNKSKGLPSFYRLGDSMIKTEPISPLGRRRLGGHGTATLVLKRLAQSYVLRTQRNSLETRVLEKFTGPITVGKDLIVFEDECEAKAHGTTIQITNEKFKDPNWINTTQLINTIRMELPLLPDFKVYINNKEVTMRSFSSSTKFNIDTKGKHMGHVHGTIYLMGQKNPARGVNIYVYGRRYGDPLQFIDLPNFGMGLANRTVAIINADNLDKAILLDRGRLRDDHPGYIELKELMTSEFSNLRRYVDQNTFVDNIKKVKSGIEDHLVKIIRTFADAGIAPVNKDTRIKLCNLEQNILGTFDFHKNVILLKESSPYFTLTSITSRERYQQNVLMGVVDVLAMQIKADNTTESFLQAKSDILAKLQEKQLNFDKKRKKIHPNVVYSLPEFCNQANLGIGCARHLVSKGLLSITDEEGLLGSNMESFLSNNSGFIPLYEIIQKQISQVVSIFLEKYEVLFQNKGIQEAAKPFIINRSPSSPCYFIERAFTNEVVETLKGGELDQRRRDYKSRAIGTFERLKNQSFALPEIAKRSSGLTLKEVQNIADWAKQNDMNVRIRKGNLYNLGDFVSSYQQMRSQGNS
jgi:hypothetical protein